MTVKELSKKYESYMIDMRREFHMNPELSLKETRTSRRIREELEATGIPVTPFESGNVVGIIKGGKGGDKRVAIRADIDALPMQEELDVPYKSTVPNVMHSCGHDAHTAILLGIAKTLWEVRDSLSGTVYLCFQIAEEIGQGAAELVDYLKAQGGVDMVIGTHISAMIESGWIDLQDGPRMAGAVGFSIDVQGKGGHGSRPDLCINPIFPACEIVQKIAAIPANRHRPFDTCVVSPCMLNVGQKNNIIAETAHIEGSARFYAYGDDDRLIEKIRHIATNAAEGWGGSATVTSSAMAAYPVINEPKASAFGREIVKQIGATLCTDEPISAGSDNYSEFQAAFPGFYCRLGALSKLPGSSPNHHNPKFDIDEASFVVGAEFLATTAYEFLNRG